MSENMKELNLEAMEEVVGGRGGSPKPLPPKAGFHVYQIQSGETLIQIARRFNTTAEHLKAINPTITNARDITAHYYIYVPA